MINLTIVSQNNRTFETVRIENLQTISRNFTNETLNLNYDNYLLKIVDINSNFSMSGFWNITDNKLLNDISYIVLIFIMIILVVVFIKYLKKW